MINHEEMSERKLKILHAIIQNYLETGEPVGSRTISKYTDLNLSSATIRNEMADLEDMGYILQPHTSAGRIPSDTGYRFYVDQLMTERDSEHEEKQALIQRVDKMEVLLKQVANALANSTNYATMVSSPHYQNVTLKFVQLSQVDHEHLLAVIVTQGNIVKNKMIQVEEPLSNEDVLKLNVLLNTFLQGLSLQDINLALIQTMREQAGIRQDVLERILEEIAKVIQPQFKETDLDTITAIVTRYYEQDTWKKDLIFEQDSFDLLQNILEEAGELPAWTPYEDLVNTEFAVQAVR